MSDWRSISSAVQKEASAFLYMVQMSGHWIGNNTKRLGFCLSKGSSSSGFFFWRTHVCVWGIVFQMN